MSKNPQALLACQTGWPRVVQRVRRLALDDTPRLKRYKDRKMPVRCGLDPLWNVPGEGSPKGLAEPCGSCGIGKPPEDQADGEPASVALFELELTIARLEGCSRDLHVGETAGVGLPGRNASPRVLVLCGLAVRVFDDGEHRPFPKDCERIPLQEIRLLGGPRTVLTCTSYVQKIAL